MMLAVRVLYEDRRVEGSRTFAPHDLVLACVADVIADPNRSLYDLKRKTEDIPLKGHGNLLNALELALGNQRTIAVFDNDKIRRLLEPPLAPCKTAVLSALKTRQSSPLLDIVLLESNLESVLLAVESCGGRRLPVGKPTPLERDAAIGPCLAPAARTIRDCVRQQMPSFERLVQLLVSYLR